MRPFSIRRMLSSDDSGNLVSYGVLRWLRRIKHWGCIFSDWKLSKRIKFQHLDLGPDGMLYLSTTVGESFYRVNPNTGAGVEIDSGVFTFIDDLQVDASGDIVFAGEVDGNHGVFRFDPATKAVTTIVDDASVNGGFFNPLDLAIYSADVSFSAADFDTDGDVDDSDLSQLLASYGSNNLGDTDGDNDTDGSDLLAWQQQYTGSGGIPSFAVPEPCSAVLLVSALVSCACRKRDSFCAAKSAATPAT